MFMKTYTVTYGSDVGTRVHRTMVDSLLVALSEDDWSYSSAQFAADSILDGLGLDSYTAIHSLTKNKGIEWLSVPGADRPGHEYLAQQGTTSFHVRVLDPRHNSEISANNFALKVAKNAALAVGVDGKVL